MARGALRNLTSSGLRLYNSFRDQYMDFSTFNALNFLRTTFGHMKRESLSFCMHDSLKNATKVFSYPEKNAIRLRGYLDKLRIFGQIGSFRNYIFFLKCNVLCGDIKCILTGTIIETRMEFLFHAVTKTVTENRSLERK